MIDEFVNKLKVEFGERLISVGLHNLGVVSFVNRNGVFIVLDKVRGDDLFRVKRVYAKYKKHFSTPLVVDRLFFENSKDSFCMEILELRENAEIVYGKNVFETIKINDDDLKRQIRYEIKSKSLVLKGSFVDLPLDRKVVDSITYRSMYNFLLIMRNMLRLKGKLINDETLIEEFEKTFGVELSAFKTLSNTGKIHFDRLINLFRDYVDEVEKIVEIVDAHIH